jgi:acyl carrier protein
MERMVDPEKFLQIFAQQFEEGSRKNISLRSAFKQMPGWSSLQALIVTVAIHDEWGISFSDEDFRNAQTVNDLLVITQKKVEG